MRFCDILRKEVPHSPSTPRRPYENHRLEALFASQEGGEGAQGSATEAEDRRFSLLRPPRSPIHVDTLLQHEGTTKHTAPRQQPRRPPQDATSHTCMKKLPAAAAPLAAAGFLYILKEMSERRVLSIKGQLADGLRNHYVCIED